MYKLCIDLLMDQNIKNMLGCKGDNFSKYNYNKFHSDNNNYNILDNRNKDSHMKDNWKPKVHCMSSMKYRMFRKLSHLHKNNFRKRIDIEYFLENNQIHRKNNRNW